MRAIPGVLPGATVAVTTLQTSVPHQVNIVPGDFVFVLVIVLGLLAHHPGGDLSQGLTLLGNGLRQFE
jgi:hypothetical protein